MLAEVTYIFHNCFTLKLEGATFLFDYPAESFITDNIRQTALSKIKATNLFVLSSHRHHDHFNPQLDQLGKATQNITCILSHDILKEQPRFNTLAGCQIVYPDQVYQINGLEVTTFLSNDEGVAFLLSYHGVNVYFGGDLANWNWDEFEAEERQQMEDSFRNTLAKIATRQIQIGFSNTDHRLPNWAGAAEFVHKVKPGLFVPMHTFGKTKTLVKFVKENPDLTEQTFRYQKTGDKMVYQV